MNTVCVALLSLLLPNPQSWLQEAAVESWVPCDRAMLCAVRLCNPVAPGHT